jgi:DNA-binding transcriptional ArsR family regulator
MSTVSSEEDIRDYSWEELLSMGQAETGPTLTSSPKEPQKSFLDLPDDDILGNKPLLGLFQSLANEIRLEIVMLLLAAPARSKDIAVELELAPSHLTRHLRLLERASVMHTHRDGSNKVYSLTSEIESFLKTASRIRGN